MRSLLFSRMLLAAVVLCLASAAARADAIDGDWCSAEGKHIVIKGPEITLPDGAQLQGNYTRHSFAYVVPENQPAAGTQMIITLVNEDLAVAKAYRGGTLPVTWKRCEHVS
jgi:hypothetical protein